MHAPFSARAQCSVGNKRRLGAVAWAWTFTARGLEVAKWLLTYWTRKAAEILPSWVADGVIIIRSGFLKPLLCVRTMHDKPGSVSRVNISQQKALLFPASYRHTWSVSLICQCTDEFLASCFALLAQARPTMFYITLVIYIMRVLLVASWGVMSCYKLKLELTCCSMEKPSYSGGPKGEFDMGLTMEKRRKVSARLTSIRMQISLESIPQILRPTWRLQQSQCNADQQWK